MPKIDLKNKIHNVEVLGMGLGGGIGGKNHTFLDDTAAYTQCTAAYAQCTAAYTQCTAAYAQCTAAYTYGTAAYMVNVRIKLPQSS